MIYYRVVLITVCDISAQRGKKEAGKTWYLSVKVILVCTFIDQQEYR